MTGTLERDPGMPPSTRGRSHRLRPWVPVTVVVIAAIVAAFIGMRSPDASFRVVDEQQLAAELGIEVSLVAVSAGGGLVDFRFKVLNAAKAQIIFDELYPSIVARNGTVLPSDLSRHGRTICRTGQTHFILYANTGTAVRVGETVSVQIGDLQIDDIAVQA